MAGESVIPGVAEVHPRADWVEAAYPVTGPLLPWSDIIHAALHYSGAATTPESGAGVRQWCRNTQRSYVNGRGYSIGYQWAVDRRGAAWELRGWALKCAANAGANGTTIAIILLVNGNEPANAAQIDTTRKIIAEAQRIAGRSLAIHDHANLPGATTATSCAGTGVRAQVYARPTSVFAPIQEDDDMTDDQAAQLQELYDRFTQDVANEAHQAFINSQLALQAIPAIGQQIADLTAVVSTMAARWTQDLANEAHATYSNADHAKQHAAAAAAGVAQLTARWDESVGDSVRRFLNLPDGP